MSETWAVIDILVSILAREPTGKERGIADNPRALENENSHRKTADWMKLEGKNHIAMGYSCSCKMFKQWINILPSVFLCDIKTCGCSSFEGMGDETSPEVQV